MRTDEAKATAQSTEGPQEIRERRVGDSDEYQFWVEEKLRNMDTDQFGHVNNAAIAMFCESGRTGLFDSRVLEQAMAPFSIVVARLVVEFHKELFFPGVVAIGTSVVEIGNSSFKVAQGIFDRDGRVASSEATCVMMDRSSKRPARVPAEVRAHLLRPDRHRNPALRP